MAKFWAIFCLVLSAVIALTATQEVAEILSKESAVESADASAELESADNSEDSALLRNFFTVNLPPKKKQNGVKNAKNRRLKLPPIAGKKTQQARLNNLFQALQNPIGCKFIL